MVHFNIIYFHTTVFSQSDLKYLILITLFSRVNIFYQLLRFKAVKYSTYPYKPHLIKHCNQSGLLCPTHERYTSLRTAVKDAYCAKNYWKV